VVRLFSSRSKFVIPAQAGIQLQQGWVKIVQVWVFAFDEAIFPGALPSFQSFLAEYGGFHGGVKFVPDKHIYVVPMSESFYGPALVLPNALHQIACYADVQSAISGTCEHVNRGLSPIHGALSTGFRPAPE
jgi:hypothetical protein